MAARTTLVASAAVAPVLGAAGCGASGTATTTTAKDDPTVAKSGGDGGVLALGRGTVAPFVDYGTPNQNKQLRRLLRRAAPERRAPRPRPLPGRRREGPGLLGDRVLSHAATARSGRRRSRRPRTSSPAESTSAPTPAPAARTSLVPSASPAGPASR